MKEFETFAKTLSDAIKSLGKIAEALAEKLEKATEVQEDVEKRTVERKAAVKPSRKPTTGKTALKPARPPARRKIPRPEEGVSIIGTVQTVIETNPGIDFKSLQEKTGFGDKQIRNTIAQLIQSVYLSEGIEDQGRIYGNLNS